LIKALIWTNWLIPLLEFEFLISTFMLMEGYEKIILKNYGRLGKNYIKKLCAYE
jgi:hypothetical protein